MMTNREPRCNNIRTQQASLAGDKQRAAGKSRGGRVVVKAGWRKCSAACTGGEESRAAGARTLDAMIRRAQVAGRQEGLGGLDAEQSTSKCGSGGDAAREQGRPQPESSKGCRSRRAGLGG